MPNLVGIGNSQVPTNAMLGGLAYQDSVGEIDLDKIKAKTSDTAVDVFVYDTRKDSDGGAWRHRTQNLSWYNEGASALRGARKEFPAVAVLVLQSLKLTIYDGDDPNLPMWMVVTGANNNYAIETQALCTAALNGIVCIGCGANGHDFYYVNFLQDAAFEMSTGAHNKFVDNIATRSSHTRQASGSSAVIISRKINDVSMTVQPNAPTDVITGLPVPTIAIATDSGISVITNDGTTEGTTVYDLTTNNETSSVAEIAFLADNRYSFATKADNSRWWVDDIQTADENHNYFYQRTSYDYSSGGQGSLNRLGRVNGTSRGEHGEAIFRQASGMSRVRYLDTLINYTTTDYNTGWMGGEVKGAYLSSTDDTNLSGTSLIANGDFSSSSTAAFTTVSGGTAAVVGGLLKLTDTGGVFCYASAPFTTVVGNQYFITADIVNSSNTANANYIRCGNSHNGTEFHDNNYGTSYGTKTFYFTATATTTYLTLISGNGVGEIGHWDNVFAYKLDNDRSVSNKGLQPYGTITKSAVATGAELVAYSGYSYNNYLDIPVATAVGNGDFSVTAWIKPGTNGSGAGSYLHLFNMGTSSSPGQARSTGFTLKMATNGSGGYSPYFYNADGGGNHGTYNTNNRIPLGVWSQLIGLRRDGTAYIYLNGRLLQTGSSWTTNLTDTYLSIFRVPGYTNEVGGDAKVALLRYSLDAPSAEQIKKIYDDEKHLFDENAKCTLYGTSDAVTALAHDDTTDILHVGTSSGRSDFRGLNRINNTTTAIGTDTLSASNGLIAEQ